jgi:hypothetical protein
MLQAHCLGGAPYCYQPWLWQHITTSVQYDPVTNKILTPTCLNPSLLLHQVVVKPSHGLQESLLLGKLLCLDLQVTAHRKAVIYARIQVDLIWLLGVLEDFLGFVALLGREDAVRLGGGDRERTSNGSQLSLLNERRVCDKSNINTVLVVADNILFCTLAL